MHAMVFDNSRPHNSSENRTLRAAIAWGFRGRAPIRWRLAGAAKVRLTGGPASTGLDRRG